MATLKQRIKENGLFAFASFALPIAVLAFVYWQAGIYLGSERSVLTSDSFTQYSNFLASFHNVLKGDGSIFYTWYGSLGLNYLSFMAYYLGGIFTPLVYFFDNASMTDTYYLLTLLKMGCIGLSAWVFTSQTFQLPRWNRLVLSWCYALMSFTLAFSEIHMWLDAVMYLPLVVLGIHRLMDQGKPLVLYVSYFLLFVSNFYMAFIVGVFSFLYYWARFATAPKKYKPTIVHYLGTSLLAGGASMIIILPTVLDLRNNGEAFTKIATIKTAATGLFDLLAKNMIGVYDTTKYDGVPFIYVGLVPLMLALLYFVSKKIGLREKLCYGSLLLLLVASFYLEPLNLFWHGMHSPNMLLFRFSFLFSFMILLLAGYSWEKLEKEDVDTFTTVAFGLIALFVLFMFSKGLLGEESYDYSTSKSFVYTLIAVVSYLVLFSLFFKEKKWQRLIAVAIVALTAGELFLNTRGVIIGLGSEWGYPLTDRYTGPYEDLKTLVDETKETNDTFYRLENLDKQSENESFNFGYSGVSMFSSIRNRRSSIYMADLGFRSWGTQLTVRYDNNTILMDALLGIKYNIAKDDPLKYGYTEVSSSGEYQLYENQYALPLGILTDEGIYEEEKVANQTLLFNQLANRQEEYFEFVKPTMVSLENSTKTTGEIKGNETVIFTPEKAEEEQVVTWEVAIPAHTQAYFSLYPTYKETTNTANVTVKVNGQEYTSAINETGQFYRLGYYEEATTVTFETNFSNSEDEWAIELLDPNIVLLDTELFDEAMGDIQKKGIEMTTDGRRVTATADLDQDQILFTTIPYDRGWKAYVDGEQVEISSFKESLITVPLTKGSHTIELVFLPEGTIIGAVLFVFCTGGFVLYWVLVRKDKQSQNN